jgi:hypothetical protein
MKNLKAGLASLAIVLSSAFEWQIAPALSLIAYWATLGID